MSELLLSGDAATIVTKSRGAAMSDATLYLMELDQTALGLCFAAVLGVIGCLAFGAMRIDIARAHPEPAPIAYVVAATRVAIGGLLRHGVHRQPQPL